jgi:NADPH-dependent 2,4-dienoyl-CoA reductase/sulfur reductase-like enzyme
MTNVDPVLADSHLGRGPISQARDSEFIPPSSTTDLHFRTLTSCVMALPKQKVVVVGAGPVGSLAALYAASRGDDVEVYELRGGMFQCLI